MRRSDPQLAAMLTIFVQLHDCEVLASPEQQAPARRVAWLRPAASVLAAGVRAGACGLLRAARAVRLVVLGASDTARQHDTWIA